MLAHRFEPGLRYLPFLFRRVVSYEQCGRESFTISNSGVSSYRPGEEVEFTPLDTFAKEYDRYVRLIKVTKRDHFAVLNAQLTSNFRSKHLQRSGKNFVLGGIGRWMIE